MKKFLPLILMLAAIMMCSIAMADAPVVSNETEIRSYWNPPYDHSVWQPLYSFDVDTDATVTAKIYLPDGSYFNTCQIDGASADGLQVSAGAVTLSWSAVDETGYHASTDTQVDYTIVVEVTNADGTTVVNLPYTIIYAHDITQHLGYAVWYPNNTVCSFGPEFKTAIPGITDDWYTFSVVDLTQQGVQQFDLVAAGAWKLGTVTVTVDGDTVVVDYFCTEDINTKDVWDDIFVEREWFTLFGDLEDVTTVVPEEIGTTFEFGKPISISGDLGGDTTVILYVNNVMTYAHSNPYVVRFWPNLPENVALREAMMQLLVK